MYQLIKKRISILLCVAMIICNILPNVCFAIENNEGAQQEIVDVDIECKENILEEEYMDNTLEMIDENLVDDDEIENIDKKEIVQDKEKDSTNIENTVTISEVEEIECVAEEENNVGYDEELEEDMIEEIKLSEVDELENENNNEFNKDNNFIEFDKTESENIEEATQSDIIKEIVKASSSEFDKLDIKLVKAETPILGVGSNNVYWYLTNGDTELHLSGTEPTAPEYLPGQNNYTYTCVSNRSIVTKVVFDDIATPSDCVNWFSLFENLSAIENIELLDTSQVINMQSMFENCSSLTTLDLSNFDTQNVLMMSGMFNNCSSLTILDLSNFNTTRISSLAGMFFNCNSLSTLNLTNFKFGAKVFQFPQAIQNIDFTNVDTSHVTDMSLMFNNCSNLTMLDLSNFNTSQVTNMSSMFYWCSSLTSLNVCNFNTSQVMNMRSMFSGCSSLTTLNLSNFNTSQVIDMAMMFSSCSSLTTLDLSNFDTSQVTNMQQMFSSCSSLTTLDLSNFDTSQVTSMYSMFLGCSSLTTLDSSNFNTSQVTSMRDMFYRCSSLTTLDVSNFNTSQVTNMASMFNRCSSLTALDLSNFNTTQVTNMQYMFFYCSSLATLNLTNFDISATSLDLSTCQNLTYVAISDSISQEINNMGLLGDWKDVVTSIIYYYDSGANKTTIPIGNGEYQRVGCYTVTFETNGGSKINTLTVNAGTNIYPHSYAFDTTKLGYTFSKWCKDSTLEIEWESLVQVNSDIVLYAKWQANTYTIVFDTNGVTSTVPSNIIKTYDMVATLSEPTNIHEGYIFAGWYKEAECFNEYTGDEDLATEQGVTVYIFAKWIEKSYTITYNLNGGTWTTPPLPEELIRNYTESRIFVTTIEKYGYMFAGWYKNSECTITAGNSVPANTDSDTIIFAGWNRLPGTYIITFDSNGGDGAMNDQVLISGETTTIKTNEFSKNGYTFVGWKDLGGAEYTNGGNIGPLTSDITLFAQWKYNQTSQGGSSSGGGGGSSNTTSPVKKIFDPKKENAIEHISNKKEIVVDVRTTAFYYDPISSNWYLIINVNTTPTIAKNNFYKVKDNTYYFNNDGIMRTGWVKDKEGNYYLFEWTGPDIGKMIFGWKKVNDLWYYFDKIGKMLYNTFTPDGYAVGLDGAWIQDLMTSTVIFHIR